MAKINRNKTNTNPSRRPMNMADKTHPISKKNKELIEQLEKKEKKKSIFNFFSK